MTGNLRWGPAADLPPGTRGRQQRWLEAVDRFSSQDQVLQEKGMAGVSRPFILAPLAGWHRPW